ncbi:metallophosphoesterase family protein [Hydrogenivirga sp. 128-5-R1-1]|uniref:metallophosphoesterase family protein n=1 Tax=Hydrogenivirga sp. 128-5-R1-1 TaxID=392423 RepID=UPI00015F1763|nr:metallophosphoesterase family protein [Hydrogenivirga sp. 128-5-R1-1]EDP76034.1 nicotinate phosphoribosyltransferase [Hydrogenivirga sp. 128-5-R1-1]
MIYFISDTHLYHTNIIKLNPLVRKPHFEELILEELERTLSDGDILYHLGDFTWQLYDPEGFLERWKELRGKKVLLMGNHDHRFGDAILGEFFDEVHEFSLVLEAGGLKVLLSHYPALDLRTERFPERQRRVEEEFFERGCDLLIHGHVHYNGGAPMCGCDRKGIPCLNVNVELHGFKPVSLREAVESLGVSTPVRTRRAPEDIK